MTASRFVAALGLCLLSQGCVGVIVGTKDRAVVRHPSITQEARVESVSAFASDHGIEYQASWLAAHWGPATHVETVSGTSDETWTYQFDRQCWCGVMPMIIVPIPLMIPTGKEKVVFLIRDDMVVSVTKVQSHWSGVGAGLFGHEGPWVGATP